MRAVIQRVASSYIHISGREFSKSGYGLLVLLGIETTDEESDADWLCSKILQMRIFNDVNGIMNISVAETPYEIMIVSQFTLLASTRKGNRPSYIRAGRPEKAAPLYEYVINKMKNVLPGKIHTGEFGANMQVTMVNDGPVTLILDSRLKE